MKKILAVLVSALFLAGCASSSKELETGDYDAALKKSAKKIKKNPSKYEEVDIFQDAYRMANKRDNADIARLKQQGNPANWAQIYRIYTRLKQHQDLALSLPPVGVTFEEKDYTNDLLEAKSGAANYAYSQGEELMAKGDQMSARKAHAKYSEAKGYLPDFRDVDAKIALAKQMGMTNVFYRVENLSGVVVPNEMIGNLQAMEVNDLDKGWVNYDNVLDTTKIYQYSAVLSIKQILVSPEQLKESATMEQKKIEDGFDYVLDANGNVTKDTLGNDIKIPKFKTIHCSVLRFIQTKTADVTADLEYRDNLKGTVLKKEPVVAQAVFENKYVTVNGDVNALSPETQKELEAKAMPFPTDDDMLMQAGVTINTTAKQVLVNNKTFLK